MAPCRTAARSQGSDGTTCKGETPAGSPRACHALRSAATTSPQRLSALRIGRPAMQIQVGARVTRHDVRAVPELVDEPPGGIVPGDVRLIPVRAPGQCRS